MIALLFAAVLALDDTPQKTVEGFVKAFNENDLPGMSRRIVGQKQAGGFPMGPNSPKLKVVMGRSTVEGDRSKVEIDAEMVINGQSFQKTHETVELRLVKGDWQIVPGDPSGDSRMPRQLIGSIAYVATNPDIFLRAKTAAKKTACLSNVKQLSLGTIMYSADHDDVLPKSAAVWKKAIMPYVKNEKIFHCPNDASGKDSYFLESRVAGKSMTVVARPAETAMIVEGAANKAVFRHDGFASLGFLDGHAKSVKAPLMVKARTIRLK